jgi:2-C-methyl-D-erythritol 4-phosphate cytidylyltransferase
VGDADQRRVRADHPVEADHPRVGVVLVAAGSGSRLGRHGPKALVEVAGRPLVAHALAGLASAGLPPAVVVHPDGQRTRFAQAAGDLPVARFVVGGDSRTASVRAGVAALPEDVEVIAVHDAARPLMPAPVIRAAVVAVGGRVVAAAPGLPVADTLKRTSADVVVATVDRTDLVGIQTPQVFQRSVLERALRLGEATDELALVERLLADGQVAGCVRVVPGSAWGRKVTYPSDLAIVEALSHVPPPAAGAAPAEAATADGDVG